MRRKCNLQRKTGKELVVRTGMKARMVLTIAFWTFMYYHRITTHTLVVNTSSFHKKGTNKNGNTR